MRGAVAVAALALAAGQMPARAAGPSAVVMVLLDTTRADRIGATGSGGSLTPALDALAGRGVAFRRHFANSHATRPSMPQLISGRYYYPSVLRPFAPDSHPRDYPFLHPDPTGRLLTDLVREGGFAMLGVSAHPWVDAECRMGRAFDRLEYVPAPSKRGHAMARTVIDRAIAAWDARPRGRPTFLYVHLLDVHVPRWLPGPSLGFLEPSIPWTDRFGRDGEPHFGRERRWWDSFDGRDFGPGDRRIYAAFYDTLLHEMDREVGRLLDHVTAPDPSLSHTMIVIAADHGEQLGEEGRIRHGDSLADAVQHVPLILAGAGIVPGQRVEAFTEDVDVAPTVAALLGLAAPPRAFDGRVLVDGDGRVCERCIRRPAVYYAWSDYQAVRTDRWLLRLDAPGTPAAHCDDGGTTLWRVDGIGERRPVHDEHRTAVMRRKLERRLDPLAARLDAGLREQPAEPFFVPVEFWRLGEATRLSCVPIDGRLEAGALQRPGWLLVRDGLVLLHGEGEPLDVVVTVPDGAYEVAVGVRPLGWLWRVPGFFAHADEAFHDMEPTELVPLGGAVAQGRRLHLQIPASAGRSQRIVTLRLTPRGAGTKTVPAVDEEQRERLRTLGYVE